MGLSIKESCFSLYRYVLKGSFIVVLVGLLATCSRTPPPEMYNALQARVAMEIEEMPLAMFLVQESQINAEIASIKALLIKERQANIELGRSVEFLKREISYNLRAEL
jgi:hypothetical protein